MRGILTFLFPSTLCLLFVACVPPARGPDKQFGGEISGAALGAGSGAITGFHLGIGTGTAALGGGGIGAVAGMMQGAAVDHLEAKQWEINDSIRKEKVRAIIQAALTEHYQRRLDLHPSRDIFPADIFFHGDNSKLTDFGSCLAEEIARMNKERVPWSRIVIASYVKATSEDSEFAKNLAGKRAKEIGDYFVRAGIEPRRIMARSVVVPAPIVIDPYDAPERYSQAIEFIPLDR
jgi:hypothetical protein